MSAVPPQIEIVMNEDARALVGELALILAGLQHVADRIDRHRPESMIGVAVEYDRAPKASIDIDQEPNASVRWLRDRIRCPECCRQSISIYEHSKTMMCSTRGAEDIDRHRAAAVCDSGHRFRVSWTPADRRISINARSGGEIK